MGMGTKRRYRNGREGNGNYLWQGKGMRTVSHSRTPLVLCTCSLHSHSDVAYRRNFFCPGRTFTVTQCFHAINVIKSTLEPAACHACAAVCCVANKAVYGGDFLASGNHQQYGSSMDSRRGHFSSLHRCLYASSCQQVHQHPRRPLPGKCRILMRRILRASFSL